MLIQEVAYQSLLMSLRKKLHHRAGKAIEELFPSQVDENANILAFHFLAAEDFPKGFKYLFRSAQRAFDLFDLPTAQSSIERALGLISQHPEVAPKRWELLYLKGQILTLLSQFEAGLEALQEALVVTEGQTPSERAKILLAQGDLYERQGKYPLARDAYQAGHDLLEGSPLQQAPFATKLGYARFHMGDYEEGLALYFEALKLMEGTHMPKEQGFAHSCIGVCLWRQGSYERASQHISKSKEYREQAHDLLGIANCHFNLANIYSDAGKADLAEQHYREAIQSFERIGDTYHISLCLNNLGSHLLSLGRLSEAEGLLRQALEIQQRQQTKQMLALILFNLGDALSYRSKWDEALVFMRKALGIFEELDAKEVLPEVYRSIARIFAEMHRFEEAKATLDLAIDFSHQVGDPLTPAVATRIQGLVALLAGHSQEAQALAREAIVRLKEQEAPLELGRAYALLAKTGAQDALEAHSSARELFTQLGAQLDLAALQ
jgi:tetratricopeptide (TPR) repeat protein